MKTATWSTVTLKEWVLVVAVWVYALAVWGGLCWALTL